MRKETSTSKQEGQEQEVGETQAETQPKSDEERKAEWNRWCQEEAEKQKSLEQEEKPPPTSDPITETDPVVESQTAQIDQSQTEVPESETIEESEFPGTEENVETFDGNKLNKKAWENRGSFHTQLTSNGKPQRIEGWLSLSCAPRTKEDLAIQAKSKEGRANSESLDGAHLIAHSLGGPSAKTHSEQAKDNVIAIDSRHADR